MLKMVVLGLLQTLFFVFILKSYLNLSWPVVLMTLTAIFLLLFSRVWYLMKNQPDADLTQEVK
ncbi:MAG: hypothetical protein JW773_13545 [Desulfuromonadales bacterium]|nr:hypothetical protein [Desulfuromonadales bacterium]